jgi:hypothetical protein
MLATRLRFESNEYDLPFITNIGNARGRWPQPSQTKSWRQGTGGHQECMALPLSLITTNAQLRPAAPCTPPPGCAPARNASLLRRDNKLLFPACQNEKNVFHSPNHFEKKRVRKGADVGGRGCHLRHTGKGPSEANDACCNPGQACTGRGKKDVGAIHVTSEIQLQILVAMRVAIEVTASCAQRSARLRRFTCCRRAGAAPATCA